MAAFRSPRLSNSCADRLRSSNWMQLQWMPQGSRQTWKQSMHDQKMSNFLNLMSTAAWTANADCLNIARARLTDCQMWSAFMSGQCYLISIGGECRPCLHPRLFFTPLGHCSPPCPCIFCSSLCIWVPRDTTGEKGHKRGQMYNNACLHS